MISGLATQLRFFLWAMGTGALLGLCYHWGQVHRRVFPKLTPVVDFLFALLLFCGLFLLSVYTRGLSLYGLLGAGLGGAGYFFFFSGWLLRPLVWGLQRIRGIGRKAKIGVKKTVNFLRKLVKKLFPSGAKWGTIKGIPFLSTGKSTRKAGAVSRDSNRS